MVSLQWVKNACQTGRQNVIGGMDGKEVWAGMQPCRRADASCRRRTIGLAQADSFFLFFFFSFFLILNFLSFVLSGVDETKATANGILGGLERVAMLKEGVWYWR